jgi:hypothetical protein
MKEKSDLRPSQYKIASKKEIEKALSEALQGRVSAELKLLHLAQNRAKVQWTLFPSWALPSDPESYGAHEG